MNGKPSLRYVLITPARNEGNYIEKTILSVISQTEPPLKWVIVSDGSTDRTDEIVNKYLEKYPWIELVRLPEHRARNFAAKVYCFNDAYERIQYLDYDILGNLDADVSFEEKYFEFLMKKFSENPELGVGGTPFVEGNNVAYNYSYTNIEHVSGLCQLFRRECFEEIGGYKPIQGGGIDWVAVTTARMKGWKTRTFTEMTCLHNRPIGTASNNKLKVFFNYGKKDYYCGGHPVWQIFRSLYQMKSKPFLLGGLCLMFGYTYAFLSRLEKPVPEELIRFYRKEQMRRLKSILYQFC